MGKDKRDEEAARALFASDYARLEGLMQPWPPDVRDHAAGLVARLVAAELAARTDGARGSAERVD